MTAAQSALQYVKTEKKTDSRDDMLSLLHSALDLAYVQDASTCFSCFNTEWTDSLVSITLLK